ncbi:hypothetical protein KFU94_39325 [Chloroflexi bacterium TSY]|nr:hypothetical protein [Chloroflexi bacterium TSY]
MTKRTLVINIGLGILVALVAASTVIAQSGGQFALTWFSVSNGSGKSEGGQFSVEDLIGEPLVAAVSGGNFSIRSEFAGRRAVENLVLLYVNGDNNLQSEIEELVGKAQRGAFNANAVVYMLVDRPEINDSQLYLLSKFDPGNCNLFGDTVCHGDRPVYIQGRNMWPFNESLGAQETLIEFLRVTISRHSDAENIILSMVGHGSGWSPNKLIGQPPEHFGQPGGGLLWDDNPGSFFSTHELGVALANAKDQTGRKIDLLYLDACLMGMWEVAYEIKDSVNYLLASESWSWTSFAYDDHLQDLADSPTVPEIGRRWMQNESAILAGDQYAFTYSLLDLSQVDLVRGAIDQLTNALNPNDRRIADALSPQICFDSNWDSEIDDTDNYCALYGFVDQLIQMFDGNEEVKGAAIDVKEAVKQMIPEGNSMFTSGTAFDREANIHEWKWSGLGGVSLYLPLRHDEWKRRYYTHKTGKSLQASVDGLWDDFLESYWNSEPPPDPKCEGRCDLPPSPIRIPKKQIFLPLVRK